MEPSNLISHVSQVRHSEHGGHTSMRLDRARESKDCCVVCSLIRSALGQRLGHSRRPGNTWRMR